MSKGETPEPDDHRLADVATRRGRLADAHYGADALKEHRPIGLALSGGGIRSATISLGFVQALARRDKFLAFDYVSTVSGGGYFGSFLRSLFIPAELRGNPGPKDKEEAEKKDLRQLAFAMKALKSPPSQKTIALNQQEFATNPINWLRENGRYLAPDGPADLMWAFSYFSRNWLGMVFVMALAAAFLSCLLVSIMIGLWWTPLLGKSIIWWHSTIEIKGYGVSPIAVAPLLGLITALGLGVGYWLTVAMPTVAAWLPSQNRKAEDRTVFSDQFKSVWRAYSIVMALSLGLWVGYRWFATNPDDVPAMGQQIYWGGMAVSLIGLVASRVRYSKALAEKDNKQAADTETLQPYATIFMRRGLTRWLTNTNLFIMATGALAVVDTLAGVLLEASNKPHNPFGLANAGATIWLFAHPVLAWIITKAQGMFDEKSKGGIGKLILSNLNTVLLAISLSLYASIFLVADFLVQKAIWARDAFPAYDQQKAFGDQVDVLSWIALAVVVFLLSSSVLKSKAFINLSSIHHFYAARLTKAYLGASNINRLYRKPAAQGEKEPILDTEAPQENDFIHIEAYQTHESAAPAHLINVTLNETATEGTSNITKLDRKGKPLTFGPKGIRIAQEAVVPWEKLKTDKAEPLSVGQLCAISGAAASSGMGRMTTFARSLALTFANVRMGYWWQRCARPPEGNSWARRLLGPIYFLWNEMTAHYSLDDDHFYLSDGGHFENSGALALIGEGCELIVVCDNEEDTKGAFEALEILIRTARIDLNQEVQIMSDAYTSDFVGKNASHHFYNCHDGDWREAFTTTGGEAFCLLLKVSEIAGASTSDGTPYSAHIIWVKPRCFEGLPVDLTGYARANPTFPHETTVDQFFEEPQWESYRRLGFEMGNRLFSPTTGVSEKKVPTISPPNDDETDMIGITKDATEPESKPEAKSNQAPAPTA